MRGWGRRGGEKKGRERRDGDERREEGWARGAEERRGDEKRGVNNMCKQYEETNHVLSSFVPDPKLKKTTKKNKLPSLSTA